MSTTEAKWTGAFGDSYFAGEEATSPSCSFERWLREALGDRHVGSAIDFGAGHGIALEALRTIFRDIHVAAVEINAVAVARLRVIADEVFAQSVVVPVAVAQYDLAMASGLLSCLSPGVASPALDVIVSSSRRYVWLRDYFAPEPMKIPHETLVSLEARDWGVEVANRYDLKIVRQSHLMVGWPGWWLLER